MNAWEIVPALGMAVLAVCVVAAFVIVWMEDRY